MHRSHVALAVAVLLSAAPLAAQSLTPDQVQEALTLAQRGKTCAATLSGVLVGQYDVRLLGPYGRVIDAAREAATTLRPFTPTDDLLAPVWRVIVYPRTPTYSRYGGWTVPPAVTEVAILPVGAIDLFLVSRPAKLIPIPAQWGNAFGGTFTSAGALAEFDASKLPSGELLVVVIAGSQQFSYTVKDKHRRALIGR